MPIVDVLMRADVRSVRETLELVVVGHAPVREAVREQHQSGSVAVGDALGLLDAAEKASRQVRHAARVDRIRVRCGCVGRQPPGRRRRVRRFDRRTSRGRVDPPAPDVRQDCRRLERGQQSIAGHRTASVDDELKGRRRALGAALSVVGAVSSRSA